MSPATNISKYVSDETIAALSSRWGPAARAVIRVSGTGALALAEKVFLSKSESPAKSPGHHVLHGWMKLDEGVKCPGQLYVFRGPMSYSGEDLVEFHLPGGPGIVQMAMAKLIAEGARPAEAGEFTLRGFLAGKMDLTQAEAVAEIISSQSDAQLRAANSLAEGVLSRAVEKTQRILAELIGDVEANIDFVDQDIDFVGTKQAAKTIGQIQAEVDEILAGAIRQRELDAQLKVVLAGASNVGKSTLLNALTGLSRAIVSGVAGTTRDVLTGPMKGEENVLLADAAGLCESSLDDIGQAGREAAIEAVKRADLVLYVLDGTVRINEGHWQTLEMLGANRSLIVVNKVDLLSGKELAGLLEDIQRQRKGKGKEVVAVSAQTGRGLDELREQIRGQLRNVDTPMGQGRAALTGRAEEGIEQAKTALQRARDLLGESEDIENPELLAVELYEANAALGAVTGQLSSEDVLADIFGRFCVGK